MIKSLILAGGFGTRLSEETRNIPKPMVTIGEKPILWHLLALLEAHGVMNSCILLGYKGNVIREYVQNLNSLDRDFKKNLATGSMEYLTSENLNEILQGNLETLETGLNSLTGLRIKQGIEQFSDELFLVTYGDGLGNIDIKQLVKFHLAHGKLATVTAVRPIARFGHLEIQDGRVLKFDEKNQTHEGWINGGFFILSRKVSEFIVGNESFEQTPLRKLADAGELMAFQHHGFWHPMDTTNDRALLEKMASENPPPWFRSQI